MLNSLIKIDDLYWNEDEGKYVVLSEKKIKKILKRCMDQRIDNLDDIMVVIKWVELIETGNLLLKSWLKGQIDINGVTGGEPTFVPNKDGL